MTKKFGYTTSSIYPKIFINEYEDVRFNSVCQCFIMEEKEWHKDYDILMMQKITKFRFVKRVVDQAADFYFYSVVYKYVNIE